MNVQFSLQSEHLSSSIIFKYGEALQQFDTISDIILRFDL